MTIRGRSLLSGSSVGYRRGQMWKELPAAERRYLLKGVFTAAVVVVAWMGFWMSPMSPAAIDRTAAQAARGDAEGAIASYLDQSNSWAGQYTRGEALWRAAVLTHISLSRPVEAVDLLEQLIEAFPDHGRVVDAHARIALIHRHENGDPVRAGVRWVAAASIDPAHPDAGQWMLNAGIALADAGDMDNALRALTVARGRSEQAVAANLAMGRLHLQRDPAQAYSDYDAAFRAGASGEARRLAHLGMATALEYLDRRDAALAELDEVAEEGEVDAALQRRRDRLRARRSQ